MSIELYSSGDLAALRRAGAVAAATLAYVGDQLCSGMCTAEIDRLVREDTRRRGGRPSQLGFQGFPAAVCTSRNDVVCHGIPSSEEWLEEGDILNVDVTTCLQGFHGDTSRTFFIGPPGPEARHVVETAEQCLMAGINAIRPGAQLGDIGWAIQRTADAAGCTVVRDYCGHGIGRHMHQPPEVPPTGRPGTGLILRPGMAFTVEPMVNQGRAQTRLDRDGWRVVTVDGSLSAQFEHTVIVTADGHEVLTLAPEPPRPHS
ncbi:type I methionyl aminopeptidase [Geothrix sp. PMB-07]|uniref:type I methionyl aminopeptidase n=1 Tax=Geothrix sp. PMB-07 TaxID=3068640 RepID=UPI002741C9D8|nr:type I methionyl aminopeptidase [Geothrix sp. PMB-07]WLT30893.1 type I methionyl aminopeptidase [Geothrix sp. PMB-07]